MEGAFGAGSTRAMIVATVTAAKRAALDAGIGAQNASRSLDEALERFGSAYFDDALAVSRTIAQAEDALAILPSYGRGRANAVAAGSALHRATQQFWMRLSKTSKALAAIRRPRLRMSRPMSRPWSSLSRAS